MDESWVQYEKLVLSRMEKVEELERSLRKNIADVASTKATADALKNWVERLDSQGTINKEDIYKLQLAHEKEKSTLMLISAGAGVLASTIIEVIIHLIVKGTP